MLYQNSGVPMRYQNAALVLIFLLLGLAAAITIWRTIAYRNHMATFNTSFMQKVSQEMQFMQSVMQDDMMQIVQLGSQTLEQVVYKPDSHVIPYFEKLINTHPQLYGIGIAYEPLAFNGKDSLHAVYCFRKDSNVTHVALQDFYDYTQQDWFKHELEEKGSWLDPYHDSVTGTTHVRYAIPFFSYDSKLQRRIRKGIFIIDMNFAGIKEIMENLELKDAQYAFLMAGNGTLLYFPGTNTYMNIETQLQENNPVQYELMRDIAEQAKRKEGGSLSFKDPFSGHEYQLFYEPILSGSWVLGLVFERTRAIQDRSYVRRQEIMIGLSGSLLIWLLICFLLGVYHLDIRRLWFASAAGALLLFLSICLIIFLDLRDIYEVRRDRIIINTLADLQRFLLLEAKEKNSRQDYIPSGVFIHSLSADSSDNITARGIVWQKYNDTDKSSDKGVYIDQPDQTKMHTAYAYKGDHGQKDGWYFKTTKNPHFDYAKYPFDKQEVSVTIQNKNLVSNKILIPDFDAYNFTGRTSLLGLSPTVHLDGWHIYQSYFNYMITHYPTTFGVFEGKKRMPQFEFTIRLERDFINPLIAGFLPILIVWFLVFAVLFITTEESAPISHILSFIGTLFFSVLLAHLRLKTVIPGVVISYMEYVYFLTYVIIFVASVNCLVYKLKKDMTIVRLHNNIITKLLFWPFAISCLLGITLVIFY